MIHDRAARSERVKQLVLHRAKGVCEACGRLSPIIGKDGKPFLIPHHMVQIADGGDDSEENVAAICSTCHDRIHYGADGSDWNDQLKSIIARKLDLIAKDRKFAEDRQSARRFETHMQQELETARQRRAEYLETRRRELEESYQSGMRARKKFHPF